MCVYIVAEGARPLVEKDRFAGSRKLTSLKPKHDCSKHISRKHGHGRYLSDGAYGL